MFPSHPSAPGPLDPIRRWTRDLTRSGRRRAAVLATILVGLSIVGVQLAWQPAPRRTADVQASPTPGRTGTPGPSEAPAIQGWRATAELTSTAGGQVVAADATFRLASLDGTPIGVLVDRLRVEPPVALTVDADEDGRAATLTPDEPLAGGTIYRFALVGPDGELRDTWAFQARQPVRVVGTLPGNTETDVQVDTGIEITFDQDGVVDAQTHFRIEPATPGRFEQHGRTLVFVPDRLKPATIYTITISRGVTVAGIGEPMAADVVVRFETAARAGGEGPTFQFQGDVIESATAEAPTLGLWMFQGEDAPRPESARLEVYRLADLDAAAAAFRQIRDAGWARLSADATVPTAGLPKVLAIDATLNEHNDARWLRLPDPLPAGWYLLHLPTGTRAAQAVLQVTDVAGYVAVSGTRTVVWANDLATGDPLAGASVATAAGALGTTDAEGLVLAETPSSLLSDAGACSDPCAPIVEITSSDGRSAFLPTSARHNDWFGYGDGWWAGPDRPYWLVLRTDRSIYRSTDTVNVWGVVRDRDTGDIPHDLELRLVTGSGDIAQPAIASARLETGLGGTFTASLPFSDLPPSEYQVELRSDGNLISSTWMRVAPIAKPAYRLEIQTGRRVYIAGDRIRITAAARFFEGTPVPGVPLRLDGYVERDVVTDTAGNAVYRTVAEVEYEFEQLSTQHVSAVPARAEEGEIAGASREFMVFASSRWIEATPTIEGDEVRVVGSVHTVDVDRLEREIADGAYPWEVDPRGAPVGGATVTVRFIELIPIRTQRGTEYDFIEKRAVPVYDYDIRERDAGTRTARSDADGRYRVAIPAATSDHDYRVEVSVGDPDGRTARTAAYANAASGVEADIAAYLHLTQPTTDDGHAFSIGDQIDVTMTDPRTSQRAGDGSRYLFFSAQRGIRQAAVQPSARFVTPFEAWAVPNVEITAVRFTGARYATAQGFTAEYRTSDRAIAVDLSVPSPRYGPGDEVTVNVRTRNAAGQPIAAAVLLRAVDEKLFAIGAAEDIDPLGELYAAVSSGVVGTYASHRDPQGQSTGGDAGGGGDDRADFRDVLLFRQVETDDTGQASATFKLSDDLTSWRVDASAIGPNLEAGDASIQVPVGLSFFVDASIAPEFLAGDQPTILVRTFGSALAADAPVTVEVTSDTLDFTSPKLSGTAFEAVAIELPDLGVGEHTITIAASTGSGSAQLADRLVRTFRVVESRLTHTQTAAIDVSGSSPVPGGDGLTRVVISDATGGRHLPTLLALAGASDARADRAIAAEIAKRLLSDRFGRAEADLEPFVVAERYQAPDGGMAIKPYASSDLELSALVAIFAADVVRPDSLAWYLQTIRDDPAETRERRMVALAGLAGLGAPVLPELQAAAADDDLTIRERLMIALGAAVMGDSATARAIATALADSYGETTGDSARLRVGETAADSTSATALMAVLAAATGDSRASAYWRHVEASPVDDELYVLHSAAFVRWNLIWSPVRPVSLTYVVAGTRQTVSLAAGESLELVLTADQRRSFALEDVSGSVYAVASWEAPVDPQAFVPDPDVRITRTVTPTGVIGSDRLVRIDLKVEFGAQAPRTCHQVTDHLPSGLVPVGDLAAWVDPDTGEPRPDSGFVLPYAQVGQRVDFCAAPTEGWTTNHLRYYARVVTPGTYAWEPAIVESTTVANGATLTPPLEIVIR